MKRKLKYLSFLLVMIILISVMGCKATTVTETTKASSTTGLTTSVSNQGNTMPIVDKPLTLTYWVPNRAAVTKKYASFAEADAWKQLAQITGITLKFIHPVMGQEKENYKLMIVSSELPDIIEMTYQGGDLYPGGTDQAIKDGIYLRLNELVSKYAPNYQKVINLTPEISKALMTDSGNLWAFQMVEENVQPAVTGPAVRQDWLTDLGLKAPETIDDWYTMLKTFKEKKNAQAPLLLNKTGVDSYFTWIGAYGVTNDFYRLEKTVKYGPIEKGFKDYITTMNKWYSEGLIDRDFVSYDGYGGANTVKKIAEGTAGALTTGFWMLETYRKASSDTKFMLTGVPYPALKKGDTVPFRQYNENVRTDATVISGKCKYPTEAIKLLDYNYSEAGYLLMNYGVEGKSYTMVNGKPVYTDYVTKNADFPAFVDIISIAARHEGPFKRDWRREFYTYQDYEVKAQDEIWNGNNSGMMPKSLSLTSDEGSRYNSTMSDINTYIGEMVPKFIMGVESMDKFDQFVEQIKKMGISDMIKIKQTSLDRFYQR